jgi:pilus assembly protein CpaF
MSYGDTPGGPGLNGRGPAPVNGQVTQVLSGYTMAAPQAPNPAPYPVPVEAPRRAFAFQGVDWAIVRKLREQVSDRLADWASSTTPSPSEQDRRVYGRDLVQKAVKTYVDAEVHARRLDPGNLAYEKTLVDAVISAAFGLGRIQPLVDDGEIENIEANGFDHVDLIYADGSIVEGPPIADSDTDLVAELQYWASRGGRTFSAAHPSLHMMLPGGGGRLAAAYWTTDRPNLVIRQHRVVDTTLTQSAEQGVVSTALAHFLHYAVGANSNIIVTGMPGAGKTTLLRALAASIPPLERYATLETERELHLDRIGRHRRMVAFEERQGSSEYGPDGRPAGEVTLTKLLEDALRMNFARLIVGEVRGKEVIAMLEAISTGGKGALATIHANSAIDAFERISTLCLTRAGTTEIWANRIAAQSLHFLVHVDMVDVNVSGTAKAMRRRFVSHVLEVQGINEFGRPVTTEIFKAGPDGRAVPTGHLPHRIRALEFAGFDRNWLLSAKASGAEATQ